MKRLLTASIVLVGGMSSIAWVQAGQPTAPVAQPDPVNFTGKVTGHPTTDIRMLRYSFEPGARTNWHSHAAGQVIVIESGRARVQERGGPVRELGPRQALVVEPGVAHWHGALPGTPLTQVSLSFGATNWMEKVTDEQYAGAPRR
jgi:quercetin dioxygenase-like cupin family protein